MSSKIGSVVSGLVSRRSYGVYAGAALNAQASAAGAVATAKTDVEAADASPSSRATKKQDKFWMRDPKTGCWVPENRFQEVDVVELRNRMIRHD